MAETLLTATDYFKPFPDPADVFATDVDKHLEFLLPLASVDLSHINPKWHGRVHFVQPVEPYEGIIGEETAAFHTELCRANWIGYRVDDRSRYMFDADFRYFFKRKLESQPYRSREEQEQLDVINEHYRRVKESYAERRDHFRQYGAVHWFANDEGQFEDDNRAELVQDLGGMPGDGNWPALDLIPLRWEKTQDEHGENWLHPYPILEGPGKFEFIGWMHAFAYADGCDCALQLFYNPESRIALTTFDWS